jgi:hypothetical protein
VSDERLAFLAARAQLVGASKPWYARLFRVLEAASGSSVVADRGMAKVPGGGLLAKRSITSELAGDQMASLVVACENQARRLGDGERQELRFAGVLPEDFLERVQTEAKELRKQWRRAES